MHGAVHGIDCVVCQRFSSWCQERKCFNFTNKRIFFFFFKNSPCEKQLSLFFFNNVEDLHMLVREVEAVLLFHRKLHRLMIGPKEPGIPHPGQGINIRSDHSLSFHHCRHDFYFCFIDYIHLLFFFSVKACLTFSADIADEMRMNALVVVSSKVHT